MSSPSYNNGTETNPAGSRVTDKVCSDWKVTDVEELSSLLTLLFCGDFYMLLVVVYIF